MDNPVYYVQYGHARIASILRNAAGRGVVLRPVNDVDLSRLEDEAELDLLRASRSCPGSFDGGGAGSVQADALRAGPRGEVPPLLYGLPRALRRRGAGRRCWLAVDEQSIANVLGLLGVSAPESMEREDAA